MENRAKIHVLPYHGEMFRILDQCLELLSTGVAFCLALVFVLRVFAPGNHDTVFIFQFMHPFMPFLDGFCSFLIYPIEQIIEWLAEHAPWLSHWIPAGVKAAFPLMPAESFAKLLAGKLLLLPHNPQARYALDLQHAPFGTMFPGVLDWRLILALPFWNIIDSILSNLLRWMEIALYRSRLRMGT